LIWRGHVNIEDFWTDSRPLVAFDWGVLAPYIKQERARSADPTVYRWFELPSRVSEDQGLDGRRT
jgi:hypothetical protein